MRRTRSRLLVLAFELAVGGGRSGRGGSAVTA